MECKQLIKEPVEETHVHYYKPENSHLLSVVEKINNKEFKVSITICCYPLPLDSGIIIVSNNTAILEDENIFQVEDKTTIDCLNKIVKEIYSDIYKYCKDKYPFGEELKDIQIELVSKNLLRSIPEQILI
jgi:hypothetical protein